MNLVHIHVQSTTTVRVPVAPATPLLAPRLDHVRAQLLSKSHAACLPAGTAMRAVGDAVLALVDDAGTGAEPVGWRAIASLGLSRDEAFDLALRNAAAAAAPTVEHEVSRIRGARCEVVSSQQPYAFAAVVAQRRGQSAGIPVVLCPLTWSHAVTFELSPAATPDTLREARRFVESLAVWLDLEPLDRITSALWWWPTGLSEPEPIDLEQPLVGISPYLTDAR